MRNSVMIAAGCFIVCTGNAVAQGAAPRMDRDVMAAAEAERGPLLDTLRELVSIESGSSDAEGLRRIAAVIAQRMRALGGEVELVAHDDPYVMVDTPEEIGSSVVGRFRGRGQGRILLLAHMDTVYQRGQLAEQPFRVSDGRAYGLGIADDKSGVALILHTLALLQSAGFDDYELITVLINGDEEVSSAGFRYLITKLGAEHDAVFSCEGGGAADRLALTTAGIGAVLLEVTGRASHAGGAPEQGRNALYELAHQMLQMRDLSDAAAGIKLNRTIASGGSARNVIPARARATADFRVLRVAAYDEVERLGRERVGNHVIPDTTVEVSFERRRPPLEGSEASRSLAAHAQSVYRELGRPLRVTEQAAGGGTDAAFAALETDAPVIEGFGPVGYGAHSDAREYIEIDSVVPRLYLLARMVMDVARGKAAPR
ncbi:MAG: glutamate carboxypeptidase [Acidobacteria bacterium]|nr:glutamate carboxypeptidase [Acidobacteriota bacterium]